MLFCNSYCFQELTSTRARGITFGTFQRIVLIAGSVTLACYAAVSPRTLPLPDYNARFYENLQIVSLATIAPIVNMAMVSNGDLNDVNALFHTFFTAFTIGYALAFVLEIVVTSVIRLGVFVGFERDVFALTPAVPLPIFPWVLRENKYRPKRITLLAADLLTSCVAAPAIEEYMKLKILEWAVQLPRNFKWVIKLSKAKKKRLVAEPVPRPAGEGEVINANPYVTHMLAASLGIKLLDATRRILLYTKPQHADKSFYAFCRGIFPIHELCGTMTVLALAKRDLLGVYMPLWRILLPAVVVHAMANFRGMKVRI